MKGRGQGTAVRGQCKLERKEMFEFVAQDRCQVCGSSEKQPFDTVSHYKEKKFVWRDLEFNYVICQGCGFVYMDPVPTRGSYEKFYKEYYWYVQTSALRANGQKEDAKVVKSGEDGSILSMRHRRIPRLEGMLAPVFAGRTEPLVVLEVGCAWGTNLAYLHERYGARVLAIEPSKQAQEYMRRKHPFIEIVGEMAEDLDANRQWDGRVDLVVLSHCLEMILDQNRVLEAIRRVLSPQGVVYIDTPNLFWQRALHPNHPFVYSPETLRRCLTKHGFKIEQMKCCQAPASGLIRSLLIFWRQKDPYLTVTARKEELGVEAAEPTVNADQIIRRRRVGQRAVSIIQAPPKVFSWGVVRPLKTIKRVFVPARSIAD